MPIGMGLAGLNLAGRLGGGRRYAWGGEPPTEQMLLPEQPSGAAGPEEREAILSGVAEAQAEEPQRPPGIYEEGGERGPVWGTGALNVLDAVFGVARRPILTALATGDPLRSLESIYNRDVASTGRDVRLAWFPGSQASERDLELTGRGWLSDLWDAIDWTDIADFATETLLDPLSYTGIGLTKAGLARRGAAQTAIARAGKMGGGPGRIAAEFNAALKARAAALEAEGIGGRLAARTLRAAKEVTEADITPAWQGLSPTLAGRLAGGESGLSMAWYPFGRPTDALTGVNRALGKVASPVGGLLSTAGEYLPAGRALARLGASARENVVNPAIYTVEAGIGRAAGALGRNEMARFIQSKAGARRAFEEIRGIPKAKTEKFFEAFHEWYENAYETPFEGGRARPRTSFREENTAGQQRAFAKLNEIEPDGNGPLHKKFFVLGGMMSDLEGEVRAAAARHGIDIPTLGAGIRRKLAEASEEVQELSERFTRVAEGGEDPALAEPPVSRAVEEQVVVRGRAAGAVGRRRPAPGGVAQRTPELPAPGPATATAPEAASGAAPPPSPQRITPARLTKEIQSEPGYVYHATNEERLGEITESGKLKPHRPSYGTDQRAWPDGATEQRSYFSRQADVVWQFSPEEGKPVVLRTKDTPDLRTESTGDVFSRKSIPAERLEYLGEDGRWHPVKGGAAPPPVAPSPEVAPTAPTAAAKAARRKELLGEGYRPEVVDEILAREEADARLAAEERGATPRAEPIGPVEYVTKSHLTNMERYGQGRTIHFPDDPHYTAPRPGGKPSIVDAFAKRHIDDRIKAGQEPWQRGVGRMKQGDQEVGAVTFSPPEGTTIEAFPTEAAVLGGGTRPRPAAKPTDDMLKELAATPDFEQRVPSEKTMKARLAVLDRLVDAFESATDAKQAGELIYGGPVAPGARRPRPRFMGDEELAATTKTPLEIAEAKEQVALGEAADAAEETARATEKMTHPLKPEGGLRNTEVEWLARAYLPDVVSGPTWSKAIREARADVLRRKLLELKPGRWNRETGEFISAKRAAKQVEINVAAAQALRGRAPEALAADAARAGELKAAAAEAQSALDTLSRKTGPTVESTRTVIRKKLTSIQDELRNLRRQDQLRELGEDLGRAMERETELADRARGIIAYLPGRMKGETELVGYAGAPKVGGAGGQVVTERSMVWRPGTGYVAGHPERMMLEADWVSEGGKGRWVKRDGMPMSRAEAQQFGQQFGYEATAWNPVTERNRPVWDVITKGTTEKGRQELAAQVNKGVAFHENPVAAYAKEGQVLARSVTQAEVESQVMGACKSFKKEAWDNAAGLARRGAKREEVAEAFARSTGLDLDKVDAGWWERMRGVTPAGPEGYKPVNTVFHDELYLPAGWAAAYERLTLPKAWVANLTRAIPLIPRLMQWWKPLQTWVWPRFHIRNTISDFVNMMQEGLLTRDLPADELNFYNHLMPTYTRKGIGAFEEITGDVTVGRGSRFFGGKQVVPMKEFLANDMVRGIMQTNFQYQILDDAVETLGKHLEPTRRQMAKRFLAFREDSMRLSGVLAALRQGDDIPNAVLRTERALYNYSRVSPAADFLRKSGVAPFIGWAALNVPRQAVLLMEHPAQFILVWRLAQKWNQVGGGTFTDEEMREYRKGRFNISLNLTKDAAGKPAWTIGTLSGVLPQADLVDLATAPTWYMANQLGPAFLLAAEAVMQKKMRAAQVRPWYEAGGERFGGSVGAAIRQYRAPPLDVRTWEPRARKSGLAGVVLSAFDPVHWDIQPIEESVRGAAKVREADLNLAKARLHNLLEARQKGEARLSELQMHVAAGNALLDGGLTDKVEQVQETLAKLGQQIVGQTGELRQASKVIERQAQHARRNLAFSRALERVP